MFEDKVLKHKRAEGYYRRNAALGNVDGAWKNFVESNKVQDPSSMVQDPRNMYSQGQLVRNTVDGSRPGYNGETLPEIMAKDKSLVAELKGFYEDGLGSETIIKNENPTNPKNKKYFTKDRLNRFFKYAKKNLGFSQRAAGKLNSKTYLDKIQKIADKPEYKLFSQKDLWTKNGPDGKPPLTKKEAAKVNAQRDYRFNNQEENIKKRNNKRKIITEEKSSNYLEGKAKGNKKLNLSHSAFFDKTSLNNLIYADASANRKMYGKFEEPLQKKMQEFMDIYNSDASPEIKNKAKIDLQKFDTDLRSKFPEYAKLKSYFNFKDTAFEPGFMYNEKLIDPSMVISEEVGTQFKGTNPKSLKSNVIIEKAKSNFKEVVNNSKRGGALLTNEMLSKGNFKPKCKTKFANGGGGLCGKAYAEKYPQEYLDEVMKDLKATKYLKSKEALAVGKSFLSKTAKVGRWANPLTLVGGEAWYSVLAGINEFSKGKSLGEAVNEGLWFIPGKHSRDLNELLGSKAKGKKGRNLPIISNEVRSQFDILTQLGVLINKEGALSGQLSMQQYENRRLEEEKTKRLFQERFEPKEISQDPNYYTNLLGDINWSKNIITPQIEERLKNTMTEGEEVFQKYKAADPEGQSYLKLQDKIKSKIVDEFNKGKTWDQADPHSGSIWNWIKTREKIPFTDPDLVAKQKKLDLLKEGPDRTITKENIPPELIEDFLYKFPEYKYTFEGAEGGLAGLMKKYYD